MRKLLYIVQIYIEYLIQVIGCTSFGLRMVYEYHMGGKIVSTHRSMKSMVLNTLFGISGHYVLYHICIRHSGSTL